MAPDRLDAAAGRLRAAGGAVRQDDALRLRQSALHSDRLALHRPQPRRPRRLRVRCGGGDDPRARLARPRRRERRRPAPRGGGEAGLRRLEWADSLRGEPRPRHQHRRPGDLQRDLRHHRRRDRVAPRLQLRRLCRRHHLLAGQHDDHASGHHAGRAQPQPQLHQRGTRLRRAGPHGDHDVHGGLLHLLDDRVPQDRRGQVGAAYLPHSHCHRHDDFRQRHLHAHTGPSHPRPGRGGRGVPGPCGAARAARLLLRVGQRVLPHAVALHHRLRHHVRLPLRQALAHQEDLRQPADRPRPRAHPADAHVHLRLPRHQPRRPRRLEPGLAALLRREHRLHQPVRHHHRVARRVHLLHRRVAVARRADRHPRRIALLQQPCGLPAAHRTLGVQRGQVRRRLPRQQPADLRPRAHAALPRLRHADGRLPRQVVRGVLERDRHAPHDVHPQDGCGPPRRRRRLPRRRQPHAQGDQAPQGRRVRRRDRRRTHLRRGQGRRGRLAPLE
mmetsp:Transcript_17397/g.41698  ORF Transcript_17397/g.41698 Transcript_17397/m.41698 type:complete len:500 (-) Transcript_17397:395-1894(-)